jgi:hypothetical protein
MDVNRIFDNLYAEEDEENGEKDEKENVRKGRHGKKD